MSTKSYLLSFLFLSLSQICSGQLYINEVMSSNNSTLADEYSEYDDWIEIYNGNAGNTNLAGMYITDDPTNPTKWMIPNSDASKTTVSSQDHIILWADQEVYQGENHIGIKISSIGETIQLYDTDGTTLIDQIVIPSLLTDQSYGRQTDGSSTFTVFSNTSPNQSNNSGLPSVFEPIINPAGGLKTSNQTITINTATAGATIYYTTDGSEPTTSSNVYNGSFSVGSSTTVRAIAKKSGFSDSRIATEAYIYYSTDLPIISINVDPDHLWSNSSGIHVVGTNGVGGNCMPVAANFNQSWEKPATITMIETDGTQAFNVDAGISIAGACSRIFPQKSFNIACKSVYGSSHFPHQIFPDYEQNKYKRIKLRNGGNEFNLLHMRDVISQSVTIDEVDIDQMRSRAAVVFINGAYWGIMNIRDVMSEHYLNENHKIADKDSVDIIEPGYSAYGGRIIEGDDTAYGDLYTYIANNSLTNQSNYNYVKSKIDITEFINYQISQIYFQNTDWPANNTKVWREQLPDAKWRWLLFDQDWTLGFTRNKTNPVTQGDYTKDALSFATDPTASGWPNEQATSLIMRKLLTNSEFKNEFIQRFASQINIIFDPTRCQAIADSRYNEIINEKPSHFARWVNTYDDRAGYQMSKLNMTDWQAEFDYVRAWFPLRPSYMKQHIRNYFGIGGMYTLTIPVTANTNGFVVLNENEYKAPLNYSGEYFDNIPMRIRAIANPGYRFSHWLETGSTDEVHTFTTTSSRTRTPVFVPAEALVINEIHYHPIVGGDEFIEIYNPDSNSKNLAGYEFTDGVCIEFPEGSSIAAGEYIILARYPENYIGNGYQVFGWNKHTKLDNGGEMLTLKNPAGVIEDQILYDDNSPWNNTADGQGFSLALLDDNMDNAQAASWSIQPLDDITPGAENIFCAPFNTTITIVSNVTCFGNNDGQAVAVASGGNGSYTYAWSNGTTGIATNNLAVGAHSVLVTDALGCTSTQTFNITQPTTALSTNLSSTNVDCSGAASGSAQLNVNGGTSPYVYNWSNGTTAQNLTNVTAGSYSVIITDANGCTSNESASISEPAAIQVSGYSNNTDCFGAATGSVQLSVNGGSTPYSYYWSNGNINQNLNNVNAGSYSVTVTDNNGCAINNSYTINEPNDINLTPSTVAVDCNGNSTGSAQVNVSGGASPYTYNWAIGSTTSQISNVTAGVYSVSVTDNNGCSKNASINVSEPNPLNLSAVFVDETVLGANDGVINLAVAGGTSPYTYNWTNGATSQDINNLSGGVYTATVTDNNGCTDTYSVTIQSGVVPCSIPSNIVASNTQNTSATLSWNPDPNTTNYDIQYREMGINSWTTFNSAYAFAILNNLNACTTYETRIKSSCSNGQVSVYSNIYTFQTAGCVAPCATVNGLFSQNVTAASAFLVWDIVPNANYTMYYRAVGNASWYSYPTQFPLAILFTLPACTDFEWYVEVNCASGQTSVASPIANFTTIGAACKNSFDNEFAIEENNLNNIKLFPNPTANILNISFLANNDAELKLQVINSIGQILIHKQITISENQNYFSLPVDELATGTYMLSIQSGNKFNHFQFIKE